MRRSRRSSCCVDPHVLIVAAGSPLAEPARDARARSAAQPLVGFPDGPALAPLIAGFRAAGIEPHWTFRSNDNPTIQGLVAAGSAWR